MVCRVFLNRHVGVGEKTVQVHHCLKELALREEMFQVSGLRAKHRVKCRIAATRPRERALSLLNTNNNFVTTDGDDDDAPTRHPRSLPLGFATAGFFVGGPPQFPITGHWIPRSSGSMMRIPFFFFETRSALYEAWDACVRIDTPSRVLLFGTTPGWCWLLQGPRLTQRALLLDRVPAFGVARHAYHRALRGPSLPSREKKCYRLREVRLVDGKQKRARDRIPTARLQEALRRRVRGGYQKGPSAGEAGSGSITREAPARRT